MNSFLRLSSRDRRLAFLQAGDRIRLPAASVEKDLWVCWTLRALWGLPEAGKSLTFKGGTSLSKVWKIIERFSEDIDLIVDKEPLGFAGEASPDRALSAKQRKRRLETLVEACRQWVQESLKPAFARCIGEALGPAGWTLEVDPDAEDGQCLLFTYPGVFPPTEAGYVRPVVKIELGARSDDWPWENMVITPYAADALPELIRDATVIVRTLTAERTFWEKAMLLHEETFRPPDKSRKLRLARHYYDLWCLITKGVADRAAADRALFARVAEHREVFFRWTWVDYNTLKPGSLRLLPAADHEAGWRHDYEAMQGPMFFGKVPSFDEILRVVGDFERQFNQSAPSPPPGRSP